MYKRQTEWLANNKKKYRQVFEESEVRYIYVDLVLINKLYDRESWELEVEIKCYLLHQGKKEVSSLNVKRQVSKQEHLFHIREGWGHKKKGSFWKKGKYSWEVFIKGEKVGTKYFYVENLSEDPQLIHPELALKVDDLFYYEGSYEQSDQNNTKIFTRQFDVKHSRYVFAELILQNRLLDRSWFAEIFIKFYNDSRDLKGEVVRLEKIKKGEELVTINAGWGSNVKGSWRPGRYDVEVIFQNCLIAESHFVIGHTTIEGLNPLTYPDHINEIEKDLADKALSDKSAIKRLYNLIGLRDIKRQIQNHTNYISFLRLRQDRGFNDKDSLHLHSLFYGNPGTGKTTVARNLGAIYNQIGLLTTGHVHEVSRVDLVGEYIGQTAPKVMAAIEKARGGVLFIDEAYSLARNNEDSKDFGKEVIELLIKEMSHPNCDFMVIAAGYPDQMKTLLESNPGLSSRFKYTYEFKDYSFSELIEILEFFCQESDVILTPSAQGQMKELILASYRSKSKNFGNARFINQLLDKAKINMGIRVMALKQKELSDDMLTHIRLEDVLKIKDDQQLPEESKDNIQINDKELQQAIHELNELIGLSKIKNQINELVKIVQHHIRSGKSVTSSFNFHTVLTGNPGTGKTTVTRICSKIFRALGLLERGHLIETDRQGLVAGYVGQTAIKTTSVLDAAMGGVLFIDEAYGLNKSSSRHDFGDEAIQTILKRMEDNRGSFYVFVAGYPKLMDDFLNTNPGLKSRFDVFMHFEDYDVVQLLQIADHFFGKKHYKCSSDAIKLLEDYIYTEVSTKEKNFGNARWVRSVVTDIIHRQSLRVSKEGEYSKSNYLKLIKAVDIQEYIDDSDKRYHYHRNTIGF